MMSLYSNFEINPEFISNKWKGLNIYQKQEVAKKVIDSLNPGDFVDRNEEAYGTSIFNKPASEVIRGLAERYGDVADEVEVYLNIAFANKQEEKL